MKQRDIDKEIEELTQRARELEKQREALAALDICKRDGHRPTITQVEGDFYRVTNLVLTCNVCGALSTIDAWYLSCFDMNIEDIYEVEDHEPITPPEPFTQEQPSADSPSVIVPVSDKGYRIVNEEDEGGFRRAKIVPNEEENKKE